MIATITQDHIDKALKNLDKINSDYSIKNPITLATGYKIRWWGWDEDGFLIDADDKFVCSLPPIAVQMYVDWLDDKEVKPIQFIYYPHLYKEALL